MQKERVDVEQAFQLETNKKKDMTNEQQIINSNLSKDYEYGFVSDIESELSEVIADTEADQSEISSEE